MGRWDWDSATKNMVPHGFLRPGWSPTPSHSLWLDARFHSARCCPKATLDQTELSLTKEIYSDIPWILILFCDKTEYVACICTCNYIYIYTDYIHHIIHKNETALKWKNQKVCTAWVAHQTGWKMIDPNMLQDGFLILDVSKKNWKPVWCFIHTLPSSWLDWEVQRRDCVGSASRTSAEPFKSSVNLFQPSTWCKVTKSSGGSKTVRKMPIGSNQHKDVISEKSSCISASSTYILASSWFLAHRSGMLFGWIQYFH